jgi:subtilase family serine protease
LLFDFYKDMLENETWCPMENYQGEQDIITHPWKEISRGKKQAAKAAVRHIPKLTGEDIYNRVSSST